MHRLRWRYHVQAKCQCQNPYLFFSPSEAQGTTLEKPPEILLFLQMWNLAQFANTPDFTLLSCVVTWHFVALRYFAKISVLIDLPWTAAESAKALSELQFINRQQLQGSAIHKSRLPNDPNHPLAAQASFAGWMFVQQLAAGIAWMMTFLQTRQRDNDFFCNKKTPTAITLAIASPKQFCRTTGWCVNKINFASIAMQGLLLTAMHREHARTTPLLLCHIGK